MERILMLREEAEIIRRAEIAILTCTCTPECQVDDCKQVQEQHRIVEQNYEASMDELLLPQEKKRREREQRETAQRVRRMHALYAPHTALELLRMLSDRLPAPCP